MTTNGAGANAAPTKAKARKAREIYELIVEAANYFLDAARKEHVDDLQDFDPSFEQVAEFARQKGAEVYEVLLEIDPHLAGQSNDFVHLMGALAIAIKNGDENEKLRVVGDLEQRSFIV